MLDITPAGRYFIDVVMPDAERAYAELEYNFGQDRIEHLSKCLGNLGKALEQAGVLTAERTNLADVFAWTMSACCHNLANIVAPPSAPGSRTPASLRPNTWRVITRAQSPRCPKQRVMSAQIRVDTHPFTAAAS